MHIDPQFSSLLGHIYNGALEESPWQSFLAALREHMSAVATTLVLKPPSDGDPGVLIIDGGDEAGINSYRESHFVLDPFVNLPKGEVRALHEFMDEQTLLSSELYQTCMAPAGLYDFLGADMVVPGEMEARLRIGRSREAAAFNEQDKALCAALLPHLERAILIHARLNKIASEKAIYAGAVEQLAVGTFVLDEQGQLLSHNAAAQALLARHSVLQLSSGQLSLVDAEQNQRLQTMLAQCLVGEDMPLVPAMRVATGEVELGLVMRPISDGPWSEGRAVPRLAVFVSDPKHAFNTPAEVITHLFNLTLSEARLSLALAEGASLDEAAEQLGITRNTAKSHLKSVFAKTGVSRQSQLIGLLLKSVASLA